MTRSLQVSDRNSALQNVIGDFAPVVTTPRYNVARFTEDLSWAYAYAANTFAKTGQTQLVDVDGTPILFQRITGSNFYGALTQKYSASGLTPFVAGQKYLVSFYAYSALSQWFWVRALSGGGDFGHGVKHAPARRVTRHWYLVQATSTSLVDIGGSPTTALGGGTGTDPVIAAQNSSPSFDMWVGGIQIEPVDNGYKDGVSLIGDSTMAGSSGKIDQARDFTDPNNREVSTVLSTALNAPIFNRAVGGQTLNDMDGRWATDMTPLAPRCKYTIIQGGINDIVQNRTLAQMQASVQSMTAKALADGTIPRYLDCTPTASISANSAYEAQRQAFNAWLYATYGKAAQGGAVIDISTIAASPWNSSLLNPAFYGDGTHYTGGMKTEIGEYVARQPVWSFTQPGVYRRVT